MFLRKFQQTPKGTYQNDPEKSPVYGLEILSYWYFRVPFGYVDPGSVGIFLECCSSPEAAFGGTKNRDQRSHSGSWKMDLLTSGYFPIKYGDISYVENGLSRCISY